MNLSKMRWMPATLACILIMMVVLSACSNAPKNEGSTNTQASNKPETTAETTDKPKERGKITASVYDRGNVPAEEGTVENNRYTKWLNEKGSVDVTYMSVPRWESQQKFNVMFASKEAPDLILEYDTNYRNQLFNQQLIMPLDDLIEQHSTAYKALLEENPILKKVTTKNDGKIYEFAKINGLQPNHILWIRGDWLENLKLDIPKTTEDLFAVAKAFKEQDPDQNKADDTYGMALSFISGMVVDFMFGNVFTIYDKQPWYPNEQGELVHDWDRKLAATAFKKRLFDAGLVDKDFLTDGNGDKAKQDFINGKLGIWGGTLDQGVFEAQRNNFPNAKMIPIPLPESPLGAFSPVLQNPVQAVGAVNVLAKNPEAVMEYVDFMLSKEANTVYRYGFEGEQHTLVNGCPVVIDSEEAKLQLSYHADLFMLASANFNDSCEGWWNLKQENATELQWEMNELRFEASKAYINKEHPFPAITSSEHMPVIPADLQINQTNGFKAIHDALVKSIISGSSYTVEKAIADGQAAWKKANGEEIDNWYANWYKENRNNAFLTSDMYELTQDVFFKN
jgi:putative aldouronate transport system substrate-binding protein